MAIRPESIEKYERVAQAYANQEASLANLCKRENMALSNFYRIRDLKKTGKPLAVKKVHKTATSFVDVPLQEKTPSRVVVVACDTSNLKDVLEHLK